MYRKVDFSSYKAVKNSSKKPRKNALVINQETEDSFRDIARIVGDANRYIQSRKGDMITGTQAKRVFIPWTREIIKAASDFPKETDEYKALAVATSALLNMFDVQDVQEVTFMFAVFREQTWDVLIKNFGVLSNIFTLENLKESYDEANEEWQEYRKDILKKNAAEIEKEKKRQQEQSRQQRVDRKPSSYTGPSSGDRYDTQEDIFQDQNDVIDQALDRIRKPEYSSSTTLELLSVPEENLPDDEPFTFISEVDLSDMVDGNSVIDAVNQTMSSSASQLTEAEIESVYALGKIEADLLDKLKDTDPEYAEQLEEELGFDRDEQVYGTSSPDDDERYSFDYIDDAVDQGRDDIAYNIVFDHKLELLEAIEDLPSNLDITIGEYKRMDNQLPSMGIAISNAYEKYYDEEQTYSRGVGVDPNGVRSVFKILTNVQKSISSYVRDVAEDEIYKSAAGAQLQGWLDQYLAIEEYLDDLLNDDRWRNDPNDQDFLDNVLFSAETKQSIEIIAQLHPVFEKSVSNALKQMEDQQNELEEIISAINDEDRNSKYTNALVASFASSSPSSPEQLIAAVLDALSNFAPLDDHPGVYGMKSAAIVIYFPPTYGIYGIYQYYKGERLVA